jgi:hypothetical protein
MSAQTAFYFFTMKTAIRVTRAVLPLAPSVPHNFPKAGHPSGILPMLQ